MMELTSEPLFKMWKKGAWCPPRVYPTHPPLTHRLLEAVREPPVLDDGVHWRRRVFQVFERVDQNEVKDHVVEGNGRNPARRQFLFDLLPIAVIQIREQIVVSAQTVLGILQHKKLVTFFFLFLGGFPKGSRHFVLVKRELVFLHLKQ